MKRLLKVTAFSGLLTLVRMMMGFMVAKVVAIYMGPSGMAMLGQLQNVLNSLSGIINAPLGSGLVRFTAEHHQDGFEQCAPWWRASVQWVLIFLCILMPTGLLLSEQFSVWLFASTNYSHILKLAVVVLPFTALGTLINSVTNGQQLYCRYIGLGVVSTLLSSSIMIAMVMNYQLQGALIAATVQSGLIGLFLLIVSVRQPWLQLSYWWGAVAADQRKAVGGYILMTLTSALMAPFAQIMIRNMLVDSLGWQEAGLWQAVSKISDTYLSVVTISLSTYFLPKLASLKKNSDIRLEVKRVFLIVMPFVSIAALGVYLLRDLAIDILFTEDFRPARDLFGVQLVGDFFKIASWLVAYPMISKGMAKQSILVEIFFAITLIFFGYIAIDFFGVIGANIAYALNYMVCFFVFVFFINPSRG